jgi:hypothetical protein
MKQNRLPLWSFYVERHTYCRRPRQDRVSWPEFATGVAVGVILAAGVLW